MNSNYENNYQNTSTTEQLKKLNGQAMKTLEETPYQPILYAIPKEMMLGFEKEVLGIYLSGHPLEEYLDNIKADHINPVWLNPVL